MRIRDITEGVGRITKQNQTVDVGPDEVTKQAAKFGNKVDKDGRPPTLSKRVKGKSTNVLFNLGLSEGYKLQLERDKEMLVLNITDTATGKRTEVRGKPGYETNYDPNDSLHILLDKIGKSANISDLMNGETVGINPKHPKGASANAAATTAFNESLDNPYPYKWDTQDEDHWVAKADTPAGLMLVMFEWEEGDSSWNIDFAVNGRIGKSGKGDEFRIFATTVAVIKDWIAKVDLSNTKIISFSADKGPEVGDSRTKLYSRFAKQMASQLGWKLDVVNVDYAQADYFKLHNPNVQENFADGKVKGKSRPGRVKRSGASCNGSVTALRKRAKNASGEKAKMLHWCANMKSGRKKK